MATVARFNPDGTLDESFHPAAESRTDWSIDALQVKADGSLLIGGFTSSSSTYRVLLLNADGSLRQNLTAGLDQAGALSDWMRIEWPSGIIQTLTNVSPRQIISVAEHQQTPAPPRPEFTKVSFPGSGAVSLSVTGGTNLLYLFEDSSDLEHWSWLGVRTNVTGVVEFTAPSAAGVTRRFFRVSVP